MQPNGPEHKPKLPFAARREALDAVASGCDRVACACVSGIRRMV